MAETLETTTRQVTDHKGETWEAIAVQSKVAHLKDGAVLAFRRAGDATGDPVRTAVEFNSADAADFALRTMSDKELRRRLEWAKTDAGVI